MRKVIKTDKKKWMTQEALNVVKENNKAYKKYRKLRTHESKDDYNRAKHMAIYVTNKARTDLETRIANNIKENHKELYSYVNNSPGNLATFFTQLGTNCNIICFTTVSFYDVSRTPY